MAIDPGGDTLSDRPTIFIGMPHYGAAEVDAVLAAAVFTASDRYNVVFKSQPSSLLAFGFNALWANALANAMRGAVTHFAMLHADIIPQRDWLDVLLDECERLDAHMVSAISPLKDKRGLTSTGIEKDHWTVRRLAMREVLAMPETFGPEDVTGGRLMVNSSCWIADLRKPAWRELDENGDGVFKFTIDDRIHWEDGTPTISVASEDWNFSRLMATRRLKYYATRKVKLRHRGSMDYSNSTQWGSCDTDNEVPL